jgi:hypothetical protein
MGFTPLAVFFAASSGLLLGLLILSLVFRQRTLP